MESMSKRITVNGMIGLAIVFVGLLIYIGTYQSPLRPNELIQPRVAVGLIMVGGFWIFITEIRTPSKEYIKLDKDWLLLVSLFGVSLFTFLYGQALLRLGVASSVFIFLVLWWVFFLYWDTKRTGTQSQFAVGLLKHTALAAGIAGGMYLLFVTFLQLYLPGILLF